MSEKRKKIVGMISAVVIAMAFIAFLVGGSAGRDRSLSPEETGPSRTEDTEDPAEAETGYLYLTGAVRKEGVYPFREGMRLFELIEEAGGLLEDADPSGVNLAATVRDAEHIRIPFLGESAEETGENGERLIDVNAAGKQDLMSLPGIGESKAEAILSYRKKSGPFRTVEDLLNVPGIGESILERIRELIKV